MSVSLGDGDSLRNVQRAKNRFLVPNGQLLGEVWQGPLVCLEVVVLVVEESLSVELVGTVYLGQAFLHLRRLHLALGEIFHGGASIRP